MQEEKEEYNPSENLVGHLHLFVREACCHLDGGVWRAHCKDIVQGQLRGTNGSKSFGEVQII